MKTPYRIHRRQQGIALLEALIAVVLLAVGLLGTVGLQARSYAAISDAGLRAEATLAAEELIGIINNDKAATATYAVAENSAPPAPLGKWAEELDKRIPGAKFGVVVTPTTYIPNVQDPKIENTYRVDITIRWTRRKGDAENRHQVTTYIF